MTTRISVRAIIHKDGRFLLTKLKQYPSFWCLPGGGLEDGESVVDCLKRELIKELGVEPRIGRLLYIHQIKNGAEHSGPGFFFDVLNTDDFEKINPENTKLGSLEIKEVGFKDLNSVNLLPSFLVDELPKLYKDKLLEEPTRIRVSEVEE